MKGRCNTTNEQEMASKLCSVYQFLLQFVQFAVELMWTDIYIYWNQWGILTKYRLVEGELISPKYCLCKKEEEDKTEKVHVSTLCECRLCEWSRAESSRKYRVWVSLLSVNFAQIQCTVKLRDEETGQLLIWWHNWFVHFTTSCIH